MWTEIEMLEIFGRRYEYISQKDFDAAIRKGRYDFASCLFEDVTLEGLRIANGAYNFNSSRFLGCKFKNCYLQEIRFDSAVLEDCQFEQVEALSVAMECAQIYHTRFTGVAFHEMNTQGSQWRSGFMRDSLLSDADMRNAKFNGFDFIRTKTLNCDAPLSENITLGGARQDEVENYRQQVLSTLEKTSDFSRIDALRDSQIRIWSNIYYLDPARVNELLEYSHDETNDPDTQEWRDGLSWNEECLVQSWDSSYEQGMQKLAAAFAVTRQKNQAAQSSSGHPGKLDNICQSAIARADELNTAHSTVDRCAPQRVDNPPQQG